MRLHSRPVRSYEKDVVYGCDERAAIHILAFLARHHPRGEDMVVRKVRRHLPDISGLLGAGQGMEAEVRDPCSISKDRSLGTAVCMSDWDRNTPMDG